MRNERKGSRKLKRPSSNWKGGVRQHLAVKTPQPKKTKKQEKVVSNKFAIKRRQKEERELAKKRQKGEELKEGEATELEEALPNEGEEGEQGMAGEDAEDWERAGPGGCWRIFGAEGKDWTLQDGQDSYRRSLRTGELVYYGGTVVTARISTGSPAPRKTLSRASQ